MKLLLLNEVRNYIKYCKEEMTHVCGDGISYDYSNKII